jgi:phage tail-like protein
MAGDKQEAPWPVPKFHFKVTLGDKGEIAFQEVSGLDFEVELIEYRAGNSPEFSKVKMPGLKKYSDITMKKGMFKADDKLFQWINEIKMNTIARQNITIQLLDEEHNVLFTWSLKNAFPMKVTGTDLNAQNSEAAIEEIVITHEGLTMEAA